MKCKGLCSLHRICVLHQPWHRPIVIPKYSDLTIYLLNFATGTKTDIYILCYSSHWHGTGSLNPSSSKTRTDIFYRVNIRGADIQATQGASASATMTFTVLNRINSVPTRYGLTQGLICTSFCVSTVFNMSDNLHYIYKVLCMLHMLNKYIILMVNAYRRAHSWISMFWWQSIVDDVTNFEWQTTWYEYKRSIICCDMNFIKRKDRENITLDR